MYPRDPDAEPGESINCFVGETKISAIDGEKIYRRFYQGEAVVVKTASGSEVTVTPNHPILTTDGWVPAGKLTKGSNLIKASVSENSAAKIDMKIMPTSFREIFNSSAESKNLVRKSSSRGDFHGDVSTGDVDIVSLNGKLHMSVESGFEKVSVNESLTDTNLAVSDALPFGRQDESVSGGGLSSGGSMASSNLTPSLLGSHPAPLEKLGFSGVSNFDASLQQMTSDGSSIDVEQIRNLLHAHHLVDVTVEPIVDVTRTILATHVYNLQTKSGIYLADGLVSHNCRCVLVTLAPEDLEDYRAELEALKENAE
jgi:hypothetical protein